MKRFFAKLIAVPVRLVADVVDFLKFGNSELLRSLAWRLSCTSDDGAKLLKLVAHKEGIAPAREMAEAMLSRENDSLLAATIGWIEIQLGQGFEAARKWLEYAKRIESKRQELLLGLELYLSDKLADLDKEAVIEEILSRNDLAVDFTRAALLDKAAMHLENSEWEQAHDIADKVLYIEENPQARWVKWVVAIAEDLEESAEFHQKKFQKKWPHWFTFSMMALGWIYTGDTGRAMALMQEAEKVGVRFENIDDKLAALAKSDEYRNIKIKENK